MAAKTWLGTTDRYARLRRIETLDPEKDYREITKLFYEDFATIMTLEAISGFLFTFAAKRISNMQLMTGETEYRTMKRFVDTALFAQAVMEHDVHKPGPGRDANRRVSAMHRAYDINQEDFVAVGIDHVMSAVKFAERFGWRPVTDIEREGVRMYFTHMTRNFGGRQPLPPTRATMSEFFERYKKEQYMFQPHNLRMTDRLLDVLKLLFPAALRPIAAPVLLAQMDDDTLRACGKPVPGKTMRALSSLLLSLMSKNDPMPDNMPNGLQPLIDRVYPNGYTMDSIGTAAGRRAGADDAPVTKESLAEMMTVQRRAYEQNRYPSLAQRYNRIDRLIELLLSEADEFVEAMRLDFGNRSPMHSFMVDGPGIVGGMKATRANLTRWMKAEPRSSGPLAFFGARSRIEWQPLGVVGVIAPWNFPVSLALLPACQALAAGNRVMLKLSEYTPRTSDLLRKAIARRFDPSELVAVTGDAGVGAEFSRLPFDHLMFTGASSVGRHILHAAADNLTPVTLELGGKSPVLIGTDADIATAAKRVAVGKVLNSGQICLAPDYVLVPAGREDEFVEHYCAEVSKMLPKLRDNEDYTSIITERHITRLQGYVEEARQLGARVIEINPAGETLEGTRKIVPAVLLNTTPQMKIRQEEIFGPLLPVITYVSIDEPIQHINAGPRPLGAYYFGADTEQRRLFLQQTHSGGVTLNDILHHAGNENLPFGGVGASGMGSYHGREGFQTFSHGRAVQIAPRFSLNFALKPPFGERFRKMMRSGRDRDLAAVRKRLKSS